MALTVIKPSGIDTSGNYTVNGMNVSANLSVANLSITTSANLGAVGNVIITGGSNGQYLQTDGSGVLTWSTVSSGSTSNISNGNSNVNIPAANGNINLTAVGTTTMVITGTGVNVAGTLNATGDTTLGNTVTANYFIGSGANLTSIAGANVTGQVGNSLLSGTVYTNAQPNITSVGTLSTLSVTGNANVGNLGVAGIISTTISSSLFTGNGNGLYDLVGANIIGQVGNALISGTVYTNAQPNITSTGSLTGLTVSNATGVVNFTTTANVTLGAVANLHIAGGSSSQYLQTDGAGNLSWVSISSSSSLANGNSNVSIPTANGNVNISAVGNANVLIVTGTGANITGTANVTGNLTAGNIIAGTGSGGNITNANVISANTFTASGNITAGNANLGNATTANYFIGNFYGTANSATTAGTVTTAAQPNITSVGTLTGITSTGTANLTGASNVALGPVANVHITGGSNGQYLQTDGSGTLTWSTVSSGSTSNISNGNSNVNIPSANGNVNISAVGNANILVITGTGANITGTANVTGNLTAGNIIAGSGSGGNISNANVVSANTFTATGNITAGNATLGNNVSANFFTGSGVYLTGITTAVLSNGNSNVNIPSANGNVNISAVGNANIVVVTGTGANVTGYANVSGNLSAGNITTGGGAGGSITGGNLLSANYITGILTTAAQPNITSVGTLTSLIVGNATANATFGNGTIALTSAGNLTGGNLVSATYLTGTLTTAAQPNITSTGTLTSLTVSGTSNLGPVGNVTITGGSNGQYLQTNGSGVLTWANVASGSTSNISNGNSNVSIATANGNITMSAVGNANIVVVTGTGANVTGYANVSGNLSAGNITTGAGTGGSITGGNLLSANYVTGTLTTAAQPNITSVGTLTSLAVTGNITSGNANLGNSVTANYFIGNLYGTANLATYATTANSVAGANVSGQVGNATVAGTVYTAAQPNITSVGTLTSLSVTGNANTGNLGTTNFIATGTGSFGGNVNLNSFNITSLATPVASTDAATKQYVDDVAQGLNIHDAAAAATPDTLANVTSGTVTYNNGSSGVGANLTTTGSFNLIDGVNVQTSGTRILVKSEANAVYNGIYTWSNATVITRATDYNSVPEVEAGDFVFVSGGTLYDNTGWVQTSTVSAIGTVGNNIEFTQFSGAGTYTAGTGLTLTGTTFSISNTAVTSGSYGNGDSVATFTVNSQGQLTAAANVAITSNAANLTGTTLNASIVTSSLTSVGTLTGLTSNGIVNFANTSNVTLGAVGNLKITGGTNAYVLQTDGTGNLSWVAQSAGSGVSNISNGNSNVSIATANGNITFSAVGTANVMTITGTGANINGTANITGNVALSGANVSLGAVGNLHITGGTNAYVLSTDGAGNLSWVAAAGTSIGVDNFTGNGVQTSYTLATTPANANATLVSIAGTFQPRTVYSLTGNVITFSSAPPNTAPIEVTTFTSGGGGGGGGGITAQDLLSPFLLMGA